MQSAFSLLVNFYGYLADCSSLNAGTTNRWAVNMSTRPLLRFHMSPLTKDHCPETSVTAAKAQVWHWGTEQGSDLHKPFTGFIPGSDQCSSPPFHTGPPVTRLASYSGYWCKAILPVQSTVFALGCAGKLGTDLIPTCGQGRGQGVSCVDQLCQCNTAVQAWASLNQQFKHMLVELPWLSAEDVVLNLLAYARNS